MCTPVGYFLCPNALIPIFKCLNPTHLSRSPWNATFSLKLPWYKIKNISGICSQFLAELQNLLESLCDNGACYANEVTCGFPYISPGWGLDVKKTNHGLEGWNFGPSRPPRRRRGLEEVNHMASHLINDALCNETPIKTQDNKAQWIFLVGDHVVWRGWCTSFPQREGRETLHFFSSP